MTDPELLGSRNRMEDITLEKLDKSDLKAVLVKVYDHNRLIGVLLWVGEAGSFRSDLVMQISSMLGWDRIDSCQSCGNRIHWQRVLFDAEF